MRDLAFDTAMLALVVVSLLSAAPVLPAPTATPASAPGLVAPPDVVSSKVKLAVVATKLRYPVAAVFAPGETKRMFVVERGGRVRIVENGVIAKAPFLDLTAKVSTDFSERGLLGMAFHPKFPADARFFVNYTDLEGDTNVVEVRVGADGRADPKSARRILFAKQPYKNHNGGNLAFGPDGKLWIGLGDGGAGGDPHGHGQNATSLLAKMLRLDVDAPHAKPEIWAKGLRNPWRYSFDRKTQDLVIADVGQDKYEEVDLVATTSSNLNFGWNVMEASHCFKSATCAQTGVVLPVAEYDHDAGCSVTGGYVYRGKALPALDGLYFYADFCTALVRTFRSNGAGKPVTDPWEWRPALDPKEELGKISSFGEDGDGELYLVSLDGTIWKLVPKP